MSGLGTYRDRDGEGSAHGNLTLHRFCCGGVRVVLGWVCWDVRACWGRFGGWMGGWVDDRMIG